MATEERISAGRIDLLDYGRLAAAIAVMLFHYSYLGVTYGHTPSIGYTPVLTRIGSYGYLGVEFFFMISGFVIFFSAKGRSASEFAAARALRLYPAFFAGVLMTSAVAYLWGGSVEHFTRGDFFANFTMLAPIFGKRHIDGSYWTLLLEVKFYMLVCALILFGLSHRIERFFVVWVLAMLAATLTRHADLPMLMGYYAYFAAGAFFAMRRQDASWRVNVMLAICLALSVHFSAITNFDVREHYPLSPYIIAAIVICFYGFFWILTSGNNTEIKLPRARQIGAITYPLYLLHQTIGYVVLKHFANEQNKLLMIPVTMLAMIALAYLLHRIVEVKMRGLWRRIFDVVIATPIQFMEEQLLRLKAKLRIAV